MATKKTTKAKAEPDKRKFAIMTQYNSMYNAPFPFKQMNAELSAYFDDYGSGTVQVVELVPHKSFRRSNDYEEVK